MTRTKVLIMTAFAVLLGLSVLLVVTQPRARAAFRSKVAFRPSPTNSAVLFEPGAELFAGRVAEVLPRAVEEVVQAQAAPFADDFSVYVCASQESFNRLFGEPQGSRSRGACFLGNILISPRAFDFEGLDTHRETVVHELSHLHLRQQIGAWRLVRRIPGWFQEGLANSVSRTGGERITESAATRAILSGRGFIPDKEGRFLTPKWARDYGLSGQMYNLQTKLFVGFLKDRDGPAFGRFLAELFGGGNFETALVNHLGADLETLWQEFLERLREQPKRSRPSSLGEPSGVVLQSSKGRVRGLPVYVDPAPSFEACGC